MEGIRGHATIVNVHGCDGLQQECYASDPGCGSGDRMGAVERGRGLRRAAARGPPVPAGSFAGRISLAVVSGRIVNVAPFLQFGNRTMQSATDGSKEEITFTGNGNTASFRYKRTGPREEFSLEINSQGLFRFQRQDKEKADAGPVEFVQTPGDPVTLSVGPEGHQQLYRGRRSGTWPSPSPRSAASTCIRCWRRCVRRGSSRKRRPRWRRNC